MSTKYQLIDLNNKIQVNILIRQIEAKLESSFRAYEFANNGKLTKRDRAFYEARYQRLTEEVEQILSHYGIKCIWAGLYPVYIKDGRQEHNLR